MVRVVSGVVPRVVPVPLCHRAVSTGFPHWLMFLGRKKKKPLRAETSITGGVGSSGAGHRYPLWPLAQL